MTFFSGSAGGLPRMRALPGRKTRIISILDVGTTKVTCLIARLKPRAESEILPGRTHEIEVIGIGHQRSRGIKSGVVVDLDAAEKSIRFCVDAAERMAGLTIESLIVSLTAGRLKSVRGKAELPMHGAARSRPDHPAFRPVRRLARRRDGPREPAGHDRPEARRRHAHPDRRGDAAAQP